jgi:hypothetical protein
VSSSASFSRQPGSWPAIAFPACEARIHSLSRGVRTRDVIRQSATKVALAPASIRSGLWK